MFKFRIRKSQNKIANRLQGIAAQLNDNEVKDGFYNLSNILLKQDTYSRSWKKIDNEIQKSLDSVDEYINDGYINAVGNYETWIRKFIDARNKKQAFRISENERSLFELKCDMYKKTDEINIYFIKKEEIRKKLQKLALDNPQRKIYHMDLKDSENKYITAKKQVENLAGYIYVIVSRDKLIEQMDFYKKLKDGQLLPEKLEDITSRLGFYQDKVSTTTEQSINIIDDVYETFDESISDQDDSIDNHEDIPEQLSEDFVNIDERKQKVDSTRENIKED